MTTLINDAFADDPIPHVRLYEHNNVIKILYGPDGFTADLSDDALDVLLGCGAIVLDRTEALPSVTVSLYRSVEGVVPDA